MSQVRVRNKDHRDYVEMFRDVEVVIKAGEYVEMGRSEAVAFLGQMTPLNRDGSGRCVQPKNLVIEQDPEVFAAERDQPFNFTAPDGKQFRTQLGMDEYVSKLKTEVEDVKPVRRRRVKPESEPATA